MGLFEPEGGGGVWGGAVLRWGGVTGAACWVAAVGWLLALSHPALNTRTYFSENALLPGLVRSDLPHDHLAARIHTELVRQLQDDSAQSEEMPVSWLVGKMSQMRLETYVHNFSLQYPLYGQQEWSGSNVYGVVRGAGAGLEALLVMVPYRPLSSHLPSSTAGLALMLAFAEHARAQRYWAKDIIFLVTQHEQLGLQAWLEAYHASRPLASWADSLMVLQGASHRDPVHLGWLHAGELPARSGHIQAAINLDIPSPDIKYVVVRGEGVNGAACNLDLLNLVHRMCDKSDVPYSHTHAYTDRRRARAHDTHHLRNLHNLLRQVLERAGGAPSGNHGLVQRYGVEGVTVEGRAGAAGEADAARLGAVGWRKLMLVLEGTLRSLNNLLERFHQSYFLYLLVDTDRFVSIGQYMVGVCLACVALLLRALSLCLDPSARAPAHALLLTHWLAMHAVSLALMLSVPLAPRIGAVYGYRTEASVLCWSACACALSAAGWGRVRTAPGALCLVLVQLACLIVCVALLNPAAGLLLAVLYTPLALLIGGTRMRGLQVACCVLLHPLVCISLALLACSVLTFPTEPALSVLMRALAATQQATLFSLLDYHIYGNWMWAVCWCVLLPVWNLLWQVACDAVNNKPSTTVKPVVTPTSRQ